MYDDFQSECRWFSGLTKLGSATKICDTDTWNNLLANETIEETFS